jgi:large subunit ribosomal protein L22
MAYSNIHRGARISPTKARLVANLIRGKSYGEALTLLTLHKQRAAVLFRNALEAAASNAEAVGEHDKRDLNVVDARVDSGPTMKRFQPKDRGRAHPILKRTSNITVAVDVAPEQAQTA